MRKKSTSKKLNNNLSDDLYKKYLYKKGAEAQKMNLFFVLFSVQFGIIAIVISIMLSGKDHSNYKFIIALVSSIIFLMAPFIYSTLRFLINWKLKKTNKKIVNSIVNSFENKIDDTFLNNEIQIIESSMHLYNWQFFITIFGIIFNVAMILILSLT